MIEADHADGPLSLRVVGMPYPIIAAPTVAERDRRFLPKAPDTSLWFDWLRRFDDVQRPRGRGRPESGDSGIGHRRPRLEVLDGTVSGAATTPPAHDLGAPE